ncbi:MAG: TIR domain-containing protein [Gammaproteobacteria bacterium]|nr:TIR domain-containing protein [Gammaproteobacteria bacterium]MBU6508961.1 TIR domain-containing protein [Gammaproteobacteria bacterium]MDE1983614.1 TIR domain-containing protein [Gammaproteobacteria bacterium]MDE2107825.1 TIR domain-containing protein [Gammaproteobacteria bacterium]MDE2459803.1 TIR domain-containing protein [Gammaproteobacteria bacterium]
MADVFVSYARSDKSRVAPLVAALEAKGWSVWWDPEINPGQEFDDQIDAEINAAKAVLVVWTPTSVVSRWVRGEAREAAERGILVPVRFEQAKLPMDVRAIHTTDLDNWREDPTSAPMQECLRALTAMIAHTQATQSAQAANTATTASETKQTARFSICVLPFTNMSGEPEQEYFSDGITEDIITDLSKVSALRIISRNSAFQYKGKNVDTPKVARELKVSHVLEGSVRKAGGRVRISAQLVDCEDNGHVWADRYDRDASDIFAIQDEISQAIVKALKLRLLPEEKKAIEHRGTSSVDAYNLYLMARQTYVTSQEQDERSAQAIVRLCKRATDIDPGYAQAWALMATGYRQWFEAEKGKSKDGMAAVERALTLDPNLAEAHAVKAQLLQIEGDLEAAATETDVALKLTPESYEVNRSAARLSYQRRRFNDAARFYDKAAALMEADLNSPFMLISCFTAVGDAAGARRAAELTLKRVEAVLAHDPNNCTAVAYSVSALATLGEAGRAKAGMERALLIDPDNFNMRYNFACTLSTRMKDKDAALAMLAPLFETISDAFLPYAKADPDFELLHDDPRYEAMVAAAEARLAAAKAAPTPAQPKD